MQYSVLFLHGKLITTYWNHFLHTLNLCGVVNTSFPLMRCWIEKDFFLVSPDDKKKVDIEDTTTRERERERERPWEANVWWCDAHSCASTRGWDHVPWILPFEEIYMFHEALSPLSGIPASYARKDLAILRFIYRRMEAVHAPIPKSSLRKLD